VNLQNEVDYRLQLAEGFLVEASQDFELSRWRSCVDNSQLCIENSGKAILALFNITSKTHDPAQHVATLLRSESLAEDIQTQLQSLLPNLMALGSREHFLTDYGDETSYTLPWDLFDEEMAGEAIQAARLSLEGVKKLIEEGNISRKD